MTASLKELRARIRSVRGMQQITKAMKLVAAAKFGRAQHAVVNARPYASSLAQLTARLVKVTGEGSVHPLIESPSSRKAIILALSSDRGLCGGYNASVFKQVLKATQELETEGYSVSTICIGRKILQSMQRRFRLVLKKNDNPITVSEADYIANPHLLAESELISITHSFGKPHRAAAANLANAFAKLYTDGRLGRLVIVYNRFQSAMTQIPLAETLLPLQIPSTGLEDEAEPVFEQPLEVILEQVLTSYMTSHLLQTLLESVASEHGARMTAMDNATRNAREMERKLQLTYQRARQAAITKELIEIISGADAL